jgi:hypothetical protein
MSRRQELVDLNSLSQVVHRLAECFLPSTLATLRVTFGAWAGPGGVTVEI